MTQMQGDWGGRAQATPLLSQLCPPGLPSPGSCLGAELGPTLLFRDQHPGQTPSQPQHPGEQTPGTSSGTGPPPA